MKKPIALLLTISVLLTAIFCTGIGADAAVNKRYKSTIAKRYKESAKDEMYVNESQAFLYDFDANGVDELVISECRKKNSTLTYYLYVYTVRKGKVTALINGQKLGSTKGRLPIINIGVASKRGRVFLYTDATFCSGEYKKMKYKTGVWFFSIRGNRISTYEKAVINMYKGKGTYKVNRIWKTKVTYNQWYNSYRCKLITQGTHSLEKLYNQTK